MIRSIVDSSCLLARCNDAKLHVVQCRNHNQNFPGIRFADVRDPLFTIAKLGFEVHLPILDYLLGFFRRDTMLSEVTDV